MIELSCTVRRCTEQLVLAENGLRCASGHHFDRAKEGYWNLTQPQDKKSAIPGDHRDAVMARHRWLKRGHASGLIDALQGWTLRCEAGMKILDLGCGDGSFGPALFSQHAQGYCGIDLSKPAIKLAARGWPEATWVLANADRGLPVPDQSIHWVVSLFGRRPITEIVRVLKPTGYCLVAVPGQDDLIELRQQVQKEGRRRSRIEAIIDEMQEHGLCCVEQKEWKAQIEIGSEEVADALAMTYRAGRHSEMVLASTIQATRLTLAADLLLFQQPE